MFNHFTREARWVAHDAPKIARELGDSSVEAEHLLLAISRRDDAVARVLRDAGLDFDAITAALVAESERSLAAVGVSAERQSFSPFVEAPRFATSAKSALERSLRIALERGDRRIGTGHVALAVLSAKRGTVPRALAIAGVDREALATEIRSSGLGRP
jgi:ATP-dependent Clp protease ATP-binding subunit ClpA